MLKKTALLLLLALPLCGQAADLQDYSKIESDCRKENPQINNSVVAGCAELASTAAKKDMNIIYQKVYKIILQREDSDSVNNLETAQKSWLASRESWCDLEGFMIGSPMYSICRMEMNISRVHQLNEFLQQIAE